MAHRIGLRRGSSEASRGSSTSPEIRIEHSHHRIADFLRELTSPHLVAWQRLNQITRITDLGAEGTDRKSTRLNSSHRCISYAVFCLKKKKSLHRCRRVGRALPRRRVHTSQHHTS